MKMKGKKFLEDVKIFLINRKRYILIASGLVIIAGIIYTLTRHPHYNGVKISTLNKDNKVVRQLIEDIEYFNQKYNGQGDGVFEPELQIVIYRIQKGDNLWNIAKKVGLSIDTLLSINDLANAHLLKPGMEILIPNKDGVFYETKEGDTLEKIAKEFNVKPEDIINVNELTKDSLELGKDLFIPKARLPLKERMNYLGRFIFPVRYYYRISSGFGWRRHPITGRREFHRGIDIAAPIGTPVRAATYGKVIFAGWYKNYGKLIILKHSGGYTTRYGHLWKIRVKFGQRVREGQVIGYVGNTGLSTGPHLHFEVRRYGGAINPFAVLKFGSYYVRKGKSNKKRR